MAKLIVCATVVLPLLCMDAHAQDLSQIYEKRGFCNAQKEISERALCFQELASDAIRALEAKAKREEAPAPAQSSYAGFVRKAKEILTVDLKDPSSVQYRGLFISRRTIPVLCGEMNARNSYGAYVGFRRFYSTEISTLAEIEKLNGTYEERSLFTSMLSNMCGAKVENVE